MLRVSMASRVMVVTAPFLIALAAVVVMGFANQRSGTCMVAAIEEWVTERHIDRMVALIEASLWVAGGFILLNALGLLPTLPAGYKASSLTALAGILFGVGAVVNRACIFGTLAHISSGDWAFCVTPVGFYLGSLAARLLPAAAEMNGPPALITQSGWLPALAVILAIAAVMGHVLRLRYTRQSWREYLRSPHIATIIIGIAFLISFTTIGDWTYSKILSDLGRGAGPSSPSTLLLSVALLAGGVAGGLATGTSRSVVPNAVSMARCLVGGAIMGVSAVLIPGGNTGLTLIRMPLLWGYAWLAFAGICIGIYVPIKIARTKKTAG